MSLAIKERLELDELKRRVAALEAQLRSLRSGGEQLRRHNERKQTDAGALRAELERLLALDAGPPRGGAKRIRGLLLETEVGNRVQPTLRTVQHHISEIRKRAARPCCADTD